MSRMEKVAVTAYVIALSLVAFFVLRGLGFADTWYPPNQSTMTWDAVTTFADGSPLLSTDVVKYRVYRKDEATKVITEVTTNPITAVSYTFTWPTEAGKFRGCVRAYRFFSSGTEVTESELSCTDDPLVCQNGNVFGWNTHRAPAKPKNLR